jgi:hypothetical protein
LYEKRNSTGVIRSLERTRRGFILHLSDGPKSLGVKRTDRRVVEEAFRRLGIVVVDEYGARIDESQFQKEADPMFNQNVDLPISEWLVDSFAPLWFVNWFHGRRVRQSSDDA